MAFLVDFALSGEHEQQADGCPDHGDVPQRGGREPQPLGGKVVEKGIDDDIVDADGNDQYQQKAGRRCSKNQLENPSIAG